MSLGETIDTIISMWIFQVAIVLGATALVLMPVLAPVDAGIVIFIVLVPVVTWRMGMGYGRRQVYAQVAQTKD